MAFSELLRITVLLVAGVATALGALAVLVIQNDDSTFAAIFGGAWWLVAAILGLVLGTPARAAEAIAPALRAARTATSLPPESDARIALMRLWPIGAFAVVCGVAGVLFPQVAAIGAGYAILIALLWRRREDAVRAIEDRDGVRFYVEPTSALEPIRLVRSPGLYRDRPPHPQPPPPPPVPEER
jgi:hypothetical protein